MGEGRDAIARTFREAAGRATATLARQFGDLDLAEEMVQDAFVVAIDRWASDGIPPSPAGWILTTARNRAIDRVRREATRDDRHRESVRRLDTGRASEDLPVDDDQLRLVFTCCHPAIAPEAQVALTLRLVAGLETAAIARAFLVPEPTMAQRLVRAKHKIRAANIPYRIPEADELPARLRSVLAVLYLVFNEGYVAARGDALGRDELVHEAIRLTRVLRACLPGAPEIHGLLALMLLTAARRPARISGDGSLVPLPEQDRSLWDRGMITEGHAIVRMCLQVGMPGPYQIQAAIAAVHADACTASATDWPQIVALYDQLAVFVPSPVVALNRAIAIAECGRVADAIAIVDALPLSTYYLWHATRADLLARAGRIDEADAAYGHAIAATDNAIEQRHLATRRRALRPDAPPD